MDFRCTVQAILRFTKGGVGYNAQESQSPLRGAGDVVFLLRGMLEIVRGFKFSRCVAQGMLDLEEEKNGDQGSCIRKLNQKGPIRKLNERSQIGEVESEKLNQGNWDREVESEKLGPQKVASVTLFR